MVIEDAADLANYMKEYIKQYREEYNRIINNGYPRLDISPYLNSKEIVCYLTNDGIVIVVLADKPQNAGIKLYISKDNSIYEYIDIDNITKCSFPDAVDIASEKIDYTKISVKQYDLDLLNTVMRLTLGVIGLSLNINLYSQPRQSIIIRNMDFVLANTKYEKSYSYLEVIPNINIITSETIWQKVFFDVRRDYIHKLQMEDYIMKENKDESEGTIEFYSIKTIVDEIDKFYEFREFLKYSRLKDVVLNEFKSLLDKHDDERTFQKFLENNPVLLELFTKMLGAKIEPQPLFPDIAKVTGNESRRPDFLIYYDTNYILIELEKPTKRLCTQNGEPSSELTQVVTQIADWKRIIKTSVDLQQNYDGIRDNCNYIIIAGRKSNDESFNIFMNRFKDTHKDITLYTYDDFIEALEKYIKRLEELFD